MRVASLCLVLALSSTGACQPPAPEGTAASDAHAAAVAAIDEANARGLAAVRSYDAAGYAAVYADNATAMNLGSPDYIGRHSIDSALIPQFERARAEGLTLTWATDTIEVHGNYAYEVGHGVLVRPARGGATVPDTILRRYITFWRREADGQWRISRDFGADVPRPTK